MRSCLETVRKPSFLWSILYSEEFSKIEVNRATQLISYDCFRYFGLSFALLVSIVKTACYWSTNSANSQFKCPQSWYKKASECVGCNNSNEMNRFLHKILF